MTAQSLWTEPTRIDEPQDLQDYSDVLSHVATDRRPVIVRRNGEDLAAVIPVEQFALLRDLLARRESEELAAQIDWDKAVETLRPSELWFEGEEPKPF